MRYVLDEGNAALWLSSLAVVLWVVQYSILARWWRNPIGITIVGLATCLLVIYIPSLMALALPAQFAGFASTTWYQWLAVIIVNATAVFMIARIVTWERLRRHRRDVFPQNAIERIEELEAENAALRAQLQGGLK